ncbi:MAG: hypothetical protein JJU36_01560, partial [Phycisphaeraceae bacterium]|nr:hypothetical protein [Phycisphaeraceae bacterium]
MDVRKAIAPFSERHWHLLSLTSRCGVAALDLVASNPSLAFALASNWVFHRPAVQRPLRAARSLLARGRKQREILAWLGFPATESTRKILARVVPASVSVKVLMFLRQQLESTDTAKALGHLQRINAGVLRIAIDSTLLPAAMPQFLAEVADMRDEDKRAKAAYLLRDSLTMFNLLYPRRRFSLVRSVEKLRTIHNSLVDDFTRISHTGLNTPFPPPPIAGTPLIEPITGSHDLVEEGRTQHNCVASFARDVAVRNRTYIYRTLPPLERCTLALRRNGGRWTVSQ